MMRALVIYDATGNIWSIVYDAEDAPQGIPSMFVDIPDGGILDKIDVTDPENPVAVFTYAPDSDLGRLQKKVEVLSKELDAAKQELTDAQVALAEQYEANSQLYQDVTDLQMALAEVYEKGV